VIEGNNSFAAFLARLGATDVLYIPSRFLLLIRHEKAVVGLGQHVVNERIDRVE